MGILKGEAVLTPQSDTVYKTRKDDSTNPRKRVTCQ